ncbi:WXG100-like domain-containing protein, partial [Streptomyces griseoluteus]|uniref:WXG100-like domain-containing protein n=1 Tax=Streptomyces griseoluteus TaxID=29306 RepID=UPI003668FDD7
MIFILTGEKLIDADEDLAYESRRPYSGLGRKLDRMSTLIQKSVHDIAESMPDDLSKSYARAMGALIDDGGKNYLRDFAEQLDRIAEGRRKTSMDIMESKWQVIAEIIRLLIEIAIYLAMSFFTGGASASQIMMAKLRSRFTILTTLSHLLQRLHLAPSLTEAFAEAFTTFAVRLAMMNFAPDGRRPDGFDWNQILKDGAFGAAAGFFTSIFDRFAKNIVKSYDTNFLKTGPDLQYKPHPNPRDIHGPGVSDHRPGPGPEHGPGSPPPRDHTPTGRPGPNPPPVTFRDGPHSFRNNPELWRNSRILRHNSDRPGALAGHYGLKGTADFLAAGSGEALGEILIKGAFDGDWSTSWSTFVGAGLSSQVEGGLHGTALNSGAELRHAIDKLRNPPTVSGATSGSGARDSGHETHDRATDDDGADRSDGPPRTGFTGGGTPAAGRQGDFGGADLPPSYAPGNPPPYTAPAPPSYTPGPLPVTAAENSLWQQVHHGPPALREQALHDLAAVRGTPPPGQAEVGVRDGLHAHLSRAPEVRVVPTGNDPATQVDADSVRRALDSFGTPVTVEAPLGVTPDVPAPGTDGPADSGAPAAPGPQPVSAGTAAGAGTGSGSATGSGSGAGSTAAGGARPGGPLSTSAPAPASGQPHGTSADHRTTGTSTSTDDLGTVADDTVRETAADSAPSSESLTAGDAVGPHGTAGPSQSELDAAPPTVDTTGTYTQAGGPDTEPGAVPEHDAASPDVKAAHPGPGVTPVSGHAPPLTVLVSPAPPPLSGSPQASALLDGAGTDRAVLLGPATSPDGTTRAVRPAVELTRQGPGAPVRVRPLTGPAPLTPPDGTAAPVPDTAFPGADVLLPLADALGPAPRPVTESGTTVDGAPDTAADAGPAPQPAGAPKPGPDAQPPARRAVAEPLVTVSGEPVTAKLATLSLPGTDTATDLHLESGDSGSDTAGTGGPASGAGGGHGPGGGTTPPPSEPATPRNTLTDGAPPGSAPAAPPARIVVRPAAGPAVTTLDGQTVPLTQLRRLVPGAAAKPVPGRAVRTLTISQGAAEDGTEHGARRRGLVDQDSYRGVRTTSVAPEGSTDPSGERPAPRTVFTGPPAPLPGAGTGHGADYFVAHATARTVTLGTHDAARPTVKVSGVQLGEALKSWTEDGDQDRPLVLFSCETGRQPEVAGLPVAQHVANRTGRPVYAPTTEVGTARDGDGNVRAVLTEGPDGPGRWRMFTPEPSGAELDALARVAGLHRGPDPADVFVRARTLQQIRTLREALGPDAEQRPENHELLAGLAHVDGLRWLGPDTAARYGDGRMTPDLLRRMTVDRRRAGSPAVGPDGDPTPEEYTAFLRAAAALRTTAGPDTTLDVLLPPPPPALPPTTLVSPEDVRGLGVAPAAQITWSLSDTPLPLSELALSPEDTAELARRRADLAPAPSRPESVAEDLTLLSRNTAPPGTADIVRADGTAFRRLTTPGDGNCFFRALLDSARGQDVPPAWAARNVAGLRGLLRDRIAGSELAAAAAQATPDPVLAVVDDLRMTALARVRDPRQHQALTRRWNRIAHEVVTGGDARRWRHILRDSGYPYLATVAPTPAAARALGTGGLMAAAAEHAALWSSPFADLLPHMAAHTLDLDLRLVQPDRHAPGTSFVTPLHPGGRGGTLHVSYNGSDHFDALVPASAPSAAEAGGAPGTTTGAAPASTPPEVVPPDPAAEEPAAPDPFGEWLRGMGGIDGVYGPDADPVDHGDPVPLETQLERHRPARLLTGPDARPPGPAPRTVTFEDGSVLPGVLTNPESDPDAPRPDGTPATTTGGLLTGPGVLTLRSPDQVAREILGQLPKKLRGRFDETELLRLLTHQPGAFTAPRGARLVGREKSGVGLEMTVEALPYHRWERFSDVNGSTVRTDTMRRGQGGTGGGRSVGFGRRVAAAVGMGPPLNWLLKIGVSLGWTRRTDYTLGTQAYHQSEHRGWEGSHLHLDDVHYRVRVERITEAPATGGPDGRADSGATAPRWLRTQVHSAHFALRDGLSWRLPDSLTVPFTGPRRAPRTLTFPDGVEPRVSDITGLHLTDPPEELALAVSGARPGSSAHRTLVSFVRPGRLLSLFGRLSGPVSGPELTRGSGRHPLGHLVVERSVPHRATLVTESVKAELRDLVQTTYQNERAHVRETRFGVQITSGPNYTLTGPDTDVRLQGGPAIRADLGIGRGHYLGTDAARKVTGRIRNQPLALYRVERTLMVRGAGEPSTAARPVRVVSLDWMSTQDARRLAGWDSRTPGRTGPDPDAEPPVPWYLTREDPVHLGGQVRAEGFRPDHPGATPPDPTAAPDPATSTDPTAAPAPVAAPAAPRDPMRVFADTVLDTLHRSYPSLFVPPLMLRHPRLARFWYGDGRVRTAMHNDRQVREALNRPSLAQSLDDLTTTGVPVTLTEDGKVSRGHHTLILRARLTDRRFESTMSERSLRNAVIGTEISGQGQQASTALAAGVELGISPRDHDKVPGAGLPAQTGNVSLGARYTVSDQKAGRATVAVAHDHLTFNNGADLYSYRVELGASFEGHRRPRGWARLATFGVLGTGFFVSKVAERPLFTRGTETVGRVELAVPAAHGSDRYAPTGPVPAAPAPAPAPRRLSATEADQLLDGTRPLPHTGEADRQLVRKLLGAPHVVLSTEGGRQRQQLAQDTADRASGGTWHVSAPGAPARTVLRRAMADLGVAGQLGQYLGPFGSRITGLNGAGPLRTHYLKAAVRGELHGLRVRSDPKPSSLEATLGNEHRIAGSASTVSRTTLGLQGTDMPLQQAPGRQPVTGSYSAALQYAWGKGRSVSATVTRGRQTTLAFTGRMYLVVADAAETVAVRDRWTAAMGTVGTRAGTRISSAAGRISQGLGRGLAPRRAAAALHRIRDAVMFHLPMQDAIEAGLTPDGLDTGTPRNLGRGYRLPAFLRGRRFAAHPSGQLDAGHAAQQLMRRLEQTGVPSHDREQVLQRLSPDFLRAHLHELTTDGITLPVRYRAWSSPAHLPAGGSPGQLHFRLTPVSTTVERLRTGYELEDYRTTARDEADGSSQDRGADITLSGGERAVGSGVLVASPSVQGTAAKQRSSGRTETTGTTSMPNVATTQAHAEIVTGYTLTVTMTDATGEPLPPRAVTHVGELHEMVPAGLLTPEGDGSDGALTEQDVPEPERAVRMLTAEQARPDGIAAWRTAGSAATGTGTDQNGRDTSDVLPFDDRVGSGILAVDIRGAANVGDALTLATARADGFGDSDLGRRHTGRSLSERVRMARLTPLTGLGTAPAQVQQEATSQVGLTAGFREALGENGSVLPTQASARLFGQFHTSDSRLYAKMHRRGARLLAVENKPRMEAMQRQKTSDALESGISDGVEGAVGTSPLAGNGRAGITNPGATVPIGGAQDGTTLKATVDTTSGTHIKVVTDRTMLFAVPVTWLSVAEVDHRVTDSRPLRALGKARRGPRAVEAETTALVWLREDIARDHGLLDDDTFPDEVGTAWDDLAKAAADLAKAESSYYDARARARETWLALSDDERTALGDGRADLPGDPADSPAVRAWRAARDEVRRWQGRTDTAAAAHQRHHLAASRLTAHHQGSTAVPVPDRPQPYTEPGWRSEAPAPYTVTDGTGAGPRTLASPDGVTVREIHDVPHDGASFFHALLAAAGNRGRLPHLLGTDLATRFTAAPGDPHVTAEAIGAARDRLAWALGEDGNDDLLDALATDVRDTFTQAEIDAAGITLTPAQQAEFDAFGRLPETYWPTAGERAGLAVAALFRPFTSEPRQAGTDGTRTVRDLDGDTAPPERRAGDHGGADLLPALAARVLGTPLTVVTAEGRDQLFLPPGADPAAVDPAADPVLFSADGFFHAALPPGTPAPVSTPLPALATSEGTGTTTPARPPAHRSHATPPWMPPADGDGPRYRLDRDGVLTAPDGATYTQGTPTGRGNGFFGALSSALRAAARQPATGRQEATRLGVRADTPPARLMRLAGLPGDPAERETLFAPPPRTARPGEPEPSQYALDGRLRRHLAEAPWTSGADRAVAEWAAAATGTTVTLVEEDGTAHTYPGPSGGSGTHVRLRRRGGDFVPLYERTPAPGATVSPPAPEEAYDVSTLSGADALPDLGPQGGRAPLTVSSSGSDMDIDSDSDLDSASEDAAVRSGPEAEFAAEFADLLLASHPRADALLDVVRRRNERLGGFPDVAFDSAFTERTGVGVPEALDQAEQDGRLTGEQYDALREELGLGTGGPFTQTRVTGATPRDREVTLRMLDRVARLVKDVLRKGDPGADAQVTPHVAVALLPDGSLGIAGNTGSKALTRAEATLVEEELRWFVSGQEEGGTARQSKLEKWNSDEAAHRRNAAALDRRQQALDIAVGRQQPQRASLEAQYAAGTWNDQLQQQWEALLQDETAAWAEHDAITAERAQWNRDEQWLARRRPAMERVVRDRTKLRALATGWYRLYHPSSPELALVKAALASPRILNVADEETATGRHGSEHGELTLLGHWVEHWEHNPGDPHAPDTLLMGGFKMACASCDLAYQAVNQHTGARLGHRVRASGTHGMFFPGWRMPQWMRDRPELRDHIDDNAETIGARLDENGVLQGSRTDTGLPQYPDSSASEYESGDEATGAGTTQPGREASPRLPGTAPEPSPHTVPAGRPAPDGVRETRPRFVVRSGFDARRFSYAGEPVTDLTVRLAIRGTESQTASVRSRLDAGLAEFLNDPAYVLPNGDRLHVTVEYVDASDSAHLSVDLVGRDRAMDQNAWWADAEPVELVHELGHQLGLRDEYREADAPHRPHVPGSLLGDLHADPEDGSLAQAGLRGRHLALLGALVGDVAAGPSRGKGPSWAEARAAAEPVVRESVWVDPVSLPRSAEGEVPARMPGEITPFRSGNFEFTNLRHTEERYRDKAVRIIELLADHPTIKAYIGGRPCRITLHVRTTETPADVIDRGDAGVEINLASYYFEKYDVGYIMGMLAHEIGLHPLASRNTDIPDEEEMFRGVPLPVPGLGDLKTPRMMNTDSAGQADHIMAAFPSSTRHGIYRDIVLKMADMLAQAADAGVEGAKAKDVTDLIDCYLMDLASIAITSDYRMNAAKEPGNTAKVYNAYKALLLQRMPEDSPARRHVPADKGLFGVVRDFTQLAASLATNNRGDSIQRPVPADGATPRLPGPAGPRPGPSSAEGGPRGSRDTRPRFVVRSGFDARRFTYDGEPVTDLTVRVALRGGPEGQAPHVFDRLRAGVAEFLNVPGHRLPNGDVLHVTVELVRPSDAPHLVVDLVGRDRAMDQNAWWVDAEPVELVHELGHQLGLRDEYREADAPHRPHVPGSLLGDLHADPEDVSLTPAGLRGRHLALLGALVGDVEAVQAGPDGGWAEARAAAEPVVRESVWVDPVSLPQSAEGGVAARMPGETTEVLTPFTSGNFEFTNLKHTVERYRDRAIRMIELLRKHDTIRDYIGGRPCRITLHVRTTETPADVIDRGDAGVEINLASYYFEKYDMGYVMGMLAHEIGLHPLASRDAGLPDEESMFEGVPLAVPGLADLKNPRTMSTEGAGQADHIMAAFPSSTRHRIYRDIVTDMAHVMAREAEAGEEGARPQDVTDLIDCYLMDLATIALTNDRRKDAAWEPRNTAKVYNAYKEMFLAQLAADSPVRALVPPDKAWWRVTGNFLGLGSSALFNNQGDSIQSRLPGGTTPGAAEAAVARPVGPRDTRPRFVVRSGFDARRFTYDGDPVTDLTVRVAISGPEAGIAHVRTQLDAGVQDLLNTPAHRLPNGDRLHVTVEYVDASDSAHLSVDLVGRDRA